MCWVKMRVKALVKTLKDAELKKILARMISSVAKFVSMIDYFY